MTEDRSRTLKLCFEEMEEITRLHDDLEGSLTNVKQEIELMLLSLNVRDYHHDETMRYLGHAPDTKLKEGEIDMDDSDVSWIRQNCQDALDETEETLLPYFKTKE